MRYRAACPRWYSAAGGRAFRWVPLALLLTIAASAEEIDGRIATVQADVRRCLAAVYVADVDTALSCTHPRIIELMGGPQAAQATLANVLAGLQRSGLQLESMTFPNPPTFFQGARHQFVFVPTLSTIVAKTGQRLESLNFQLGIFDAAQAKWHYVEGSRVNPSNIGLLFDDFPKEVSFPPFYRKKL